VNRPVLPPWLVIALRYFRAGRSGFVSFVSFVSLTSLALGIAALIVVLSVMNGFDRALQHRILGLVPLAFVENVLDPRAIPASPLIAGAARFVRTQGMISHQGSVHVLQLYGIEPQRESVMSTLGDAMRSGALEALTPQARGIVIGRPLAFFLRLLPGDKVSVIVLRRRPDGRVVPVVLAVTLVGTFEVGAELDYLLAFLHVDDLLQVGALAGERGVRLAVHDPFDVRRLHDAIAPLLPAGARWSDWSESYGQLFDTVAMEKSMMGALLALIVAIAGFSIVAGLAMLVGEKRADVAMLATMGLDRRDLARIFAAQGVLVGLFGIAIGVPTGVALSFTITRIASFLQSVFGVTMLQGTYFDSVPSHLVWSDVLLVSCGAWIMSTAAAIQPALRAYRLQPARVLQQY